MTGVLRLVRLDDKRLALRGIDSAVALCLDLVPAILARREDPSVRGRFYQDPAPGDAVRNAEWRRLVDPELRHLFELARETLAADLAGLDHRRGEVVLPPEHLKAWMSAINQARLVLAEQHRLDEGDLSQPEVDERSPRSRAVVQVRVLAYVLQVLVEQALGGG